jgi:polyhydroxyalkanoate synthesis regulator phasin
VPGGGVACEGELSSVYELLSQVRDTGLATGQEGVTINRQEQAKALIDELAAIKREEDNQRNSGGGFFDSVAKVVSDVVKDVLHGQLDVAVSDAGQDLAAAWNSPHFWSDLQKGLEQVAAVAQAVSGVARQVGGEAGAIVAAAACSVDQGAELGAQLASARGEVFEAEGEAAHADVVWSKADIERLERQVASLVGDAKAGDQSLGRALADVAGAISNNDSALVSSTALRG